MTHKPGKNFAKILEKEAILAKKSLAGMNIYMRHVLSFKNPEIHSLMMKIYEPQIKKAEELRQAAIKSAHRVLEHQKTRDPALLYKELSKNAEIRGRFFDYVNKLSIEMSVIAPKKRM